MKFIRFCGFIKRSIGFYLFLNFLILSAQINTQNNIQILKSQIDSFRYKKDFKKQLFTSRKLLSFIIENKLDTSIEFPQSLKIIGNSFDDLEKKDSALFYWLKSLKILEYQKRLNSIVAANNYYNIGQFYYNHSKFILSIEYYQKAAKIYEQLTNINPILVSDVFYFLGKSFLKNYNFSSAVIYFEKALEFEMKFLGTKHSRTIETSNQLGDIFWEIGDFQKSIVYYQKTLEFHKNLKGTNNSEYADFLLDLGIAYMDLGNYQLAESYIKQAVKIYSNVNGTRNQDYAWCLNAFGNLYSDLGDFKLAEKYYLEAMKIVKEMDKNDEYYASFLNNLGVLYSGIGNLKLAENYYLESSSIRKKILGENNSDYAASLNNLGDLYEKMGNFKLSEKYYSQAFKTYSNIYGLSHPDIAMLHYNFAELYEKMKKYNLSEIYYRKSLDLYRVIFGENHPMVIEVQSEYAKLLLKLSRKFEAFKIFNDNFIKNSKEITDNFEWLGDNQKEAYWNNKFDFFENLNLFAYLSYTDIPESVGLSYNSALLSKSTLLEAKVSKENYFREIDELRSELSLRRKYLAKLESQLDVNLLELEMLRKEADSIDKQLTFSWPEYAKQKKNLNISWQQVQENLLPGEAAIEFVRLHKFDDSVYFYNALILRNDYKYPILIPICNENQIKIIEPKSGFIQLYNLIWKPLENSLKDIKTIFYSPVGLLNNVPFHALILPNDIKVKSMPDTSSLRGAFINSNKITFENDVSFLMDRYNLYQLISTRYLAVDLKNKLDKSIEKNITLFGGVNYNFLPNNEFFTDTFNLNFSIRLNDKFNNSTFTYLESTKTEVQHILTKVKHKNWFSQIYLYNDATEENLFNLENKNAPSILHIATHGYSFPIQYSLKKSLLNLPLVFQLNPNPMVRSGLILSGGNWSWLGSDTLEKLGAKENGILTALEVSQLNLKKTQLVVLSACETGLGQNIGSEGTFGLKRGFKLAGVDKMIVSLWAVPDLETKELMSFFYDDLTLTLNPIKSFEKAQKLMRKNYPNDPSKWAGFVLIL